MTATAAFITSIAALIAAIAWPLAIVVVFLLFRSQIRTAFEKLPSVMDRMQKVKIGILEAELNEQAAAIMEKDAKNPDGITAQQIRSAAKIEVQAQSIDEHALRDQLKQLCIEYDTVRKLLPSGAERSQAMTRIMVKLRMLGPAVAKFIGELKVSQSAGERLAAVAIMQIEPDEADIPWLTERFRIEQPFIFFQAAVALQSVARSGVSGKVTEAVDAAKTALDLVKGFTGTPDQSTLNILTSIVGS